jgi:hypothetical protein
MAEPVHRIGTRAANAEVHPGLTTGGRKRRTKAQIEADNAAKAAKQQATQQLLQRIADLEKQLGQEDNTTPRPRPRPKPRQKILDQTTDQTTIASDADKEMGDNESGNATEDEYKPNMDILTEYQTEETGTQDSATEDQPPKKKQRKGKTAVRDTIKAIKEKTVGEGRDESEGGKLDDKGSKVADVATSGAKAPNTCVPVSIKIRT